jgi:hypothetical protein
MANRCRLQAVWLFDILAAESLFDLREDLKIFRD